MQSQQLLPKGEVLKEEFFSGAKDGDDPAKQMSKARKHHEIIAKSAPGRCASKSLILRTRRVLARHSLHALIRHSLYAENNSYHQKRRGHNVDDLPI
jgi:hypothetical protein